MGVGVVQSVRNVEINVRNLNRTGSACPIGIEGQYVRCRIVDELRRVCRRCPGGIRDEVRRIQRSLVGAADRKPTPKSGKGEIEAVASNREIKNLVDALAGRLIDEVVVTRAARHGVSAAATP